MIYIIAALYVLGAISILFLIDVLEGLCSEGLTKIEKVGLLLLWPLIAIIVAIFIVYKGIKEN